MNTNQIVKKNNGNSSFPGRSMNSWVDQILQENLNRFFGDDPWYTGTGRPIQVPVNFQDTDLTSEMELVAPGLQKEDFKINVSRDVLTVSYEHSAGSEEKKDTEGWLRREYQLHAFSRSFNIDDSVDMNKITAAYKNGILHLTLPKQEKAQKVTKSINVQ